MYRMLLINKENSEFLYEFMNRKLRGKKIRIFYLLFFYWSELYVFY